MDNEIRRCLSCKKTIRGHFNRKRCRPCAKRLVKRPVGKLTPQQERKVRRLAGTMKQNELAQEIGCSRTNLIRWARDHKVSLDSLSFKPEVVKKVCAYYERHGKRKTQKHFPQVKVRSIVERYKLFKPRQIKWTDKQIIESARMAGLVSPGAQAKYFNRPGAFSGSIKSLWMKRFGFGACSINGMTHWSAKHLVTSNARYIRPVGESRDGKPCEFRRMILWVDMEKCLKPEAPLFIKEAVGTMADFQRYLWKSPEPKRKILSMIKAREFR
jgi:DNA-binding XRE family transcriptional regulator